jgi:hypothetical protein
LYIQDDVDQAIADHQEASQRYADLHYPLGYPHDRGLVPPHLADPVNAEVDHRTVEKHHQKVDQDIGQLLPCNRQKPDKKIDIDMHPAPHGHRSPKGRGIDEQGFHGFIAAQDGRVETIAQKYLKDGDQKDRREKQRYGPVDYSCQYMFRFFQHFAVTQKWFCRYRRTVSAKQIMLQLRARALQESPSQKEKETLLKMII